MGMFAHNIHLYRQPRSTRPASIAWAVEGEALRKDQIANGEWRSDDLFRVSQQGETVYGPTTFPKAWMWMFDNHAEANGLLIHPVAPSAVDFQMLAEQRQASQDARELAAWASGR